MVLSVPAVRTRELRFRKLGVRFGKRARIIEEARMRIAMKMERYIYATMDWCEVEVAV